MAFSWCEPIDKLMYWRADNWVKCDVKESKLLIRIHYDQLLIMADTKVLESINMTCKIKGIYKENILILIISTGGIDIRKIKFQILSNAVPSFQKLGEHFPIIEHNNRNQNKNIMTPKYKKIDDVMKQALDTKDILTSASFNPSPVHQNFVKMCLLDPTFPQTVLETKHILELVMKK